MLVATPRAGTFAEGGPYVMVFCHCEIILEGSEHRILDRQPTGTGRDRSVRLQLHGYVTITVTVKYINGSVTALARVRWLRFTVRMGH